MAGVTVVVARVLEEVGATPEAGAKITSRAEVVEAVVVVIAARLAARAELALLAVVLARATLTLAAERAIRCGGYHSFSCGSSRGVSI
eukprot:6189743-Pleurochrysis_carterae.AAC.1